MAETGNNQKQDNTEKKFTEFPKDLAEKFQGSEGSQDNNFNKEDLKDVVKNLEAFNNKMGYEVGNMMMEGDKYLNNLPSGFQSIFKNADGDAQKKIFNHVKVYNDHFEFKLTVNGQETIVPIARKNLLIDKEVPGSLETHNGMSYGKLGGNYIPKGSEITKDMLEQMVNLMPDQDYVEGKPNTAGYQLSLLLDVPVAAYSRGQGEAYENGMAYIYTGAKDAQGRHLKLWRYDDEDMETGGIDWHSPDELLPMRTIGGVSKYQGMSV